jgi:acetate kinase
VLVFNCGSSSLKYRLIEIPGECELAGGECQRIGPKTAEPPRIIHRVNGASETIVTEMKDHGEAFTKVLEILASKGGNVPDVLGHRVVHGGDIFKGHAIMNGPNIELLRTTLPLAPLHNPPAFALIEACHKLYPQIPQVAVFDTAFHSSIPEYAYTFPLPSAIRTKLKIRKYGFHGTSHDYVVERASNYLGIPLEKFNAVSCHLGSGGASLCAVVNGKSVDNTMGFTPQPGLVMSTRSGDMDPAVTLGLSAGAVGGFGEVEDFLNKKSGVLGMSGMSADIRDIMKASRGENQPDNRIALTLQVYIWRLRKALGAYCAVTGVPHAVIFTDTIGEKVADIRWAVCAGMEAFGICPDMKKNTSNDKLPLEFSKQGSQVKLLAIETNEELAIARVSASVYLNRKNKSI